MPATGSPTTLVGGRYRIGERLGQGGMADVHDGWDERLDRPVAVKLLRPEMRARPEVRRRFEVEGRAAARLGHPNVVAVFDTGEHEGAPYLVMERLPGTTLADHLAAGPRPAAEVERLAREVLGALGAAHAAGVVHRDVKPANILLAPDGRAKVADFGIAKTAELAAGDATTAGVLLGTPAYLAPERVDGQPATARSDLYSLGVVLYEALSGAKPFQAPTPLAMAAAIQTETPPPLTEACPGAPAGLAAAVAAAMARDPADRPASAGAMAALLGAGRAAPPGAVPGPAVQRDATAVLAVPARRRRRVRGPWWAAGLALVVVLLAAALALGGDGTPEAGAGATPQAGALRELAGRVAEGDGSRGPEAAGRLRALAEGAGVDVAAARALAADAVAWHAAGELTTAAATEIVGLLAQLPGVGPLPAVVATTAPPASVAPAAPAGGRDGEGVGGGHDDGGGGRGKGGRGKKGGRGDG